jgi:putative membrane protein
MKSIVLGVAVAAILTGGPCLAQPAQSTATGNGNQAVATTSANAPVPAKGSNSFTMSEARARLQADGFSNVSDLTEDDNGVWHGKAQKNGSTTGVWLDYKGDVGTAQ